MPHCHTAFPDLYVNDGQLDPETIGLLEPTCPHTTSMRGAQTQVIHASTLNNDENGIIRLGRDLR
ncbi:uncharacterized protein BO97DRAFT_423759 [Aspergillus homomorphus CBS 101889]|uniref:Uncharacterized protein n=1 Tax=Aspergillus homomorphus (strain CBS 101889) TaxID=1450537 RepID=A0A395I3I4_ASPHC|nr:hypothetical protein BO97DRAFT_423759 [Aspergillus homomorphus CBS 101889]RAL13054.1 hypothetical protein BO97DRAFT_423759 [Aspergillus homomorphus CBS 101889]